VRRRCGGELDERHHRRREVEAGGREKVGTLAAVERRGPGVAVVPIEVDVAAVPAGGAHLGPGRARPCGHARPRRPGGARDEGSNAAHDASAEPARSLNPPGSNTHGTRRRATGRTDDGNVASREDSTAIEHSKADRHFRHDGPGHVGLVHHQVDDLIVGDAREQRLQVAAKVLASAQPLRPAGRGEGELDLDIFAAQVEVTAEVTTARRSKPARSRSADSDIPSSSLLAIRTDSPVDKLYYADRQSVR